MKIEKLMIICGTDVKDLFWMLPKAIDVRKEKRYRLNVLRFFESFETPGYAVTLLPTSEQYYPTFLGFADIIQIEPSASGRLNNV